MALIKCKECGREISDKAIACPGCGYQLKNNHITNDEIEKNDESIKTNAMSLNENEDVKSVNEIETKNNKSNKKIVAIVIGVAIIALIALAIKSLGGKSASDVDTNTSVVEENNETENSKETESEKKLDVQVAWEDGEAPTEVGNADSSAKILDAKIVNSSYGMLLVMDFEYTNNQDDARNFINDMNCSINPYQNGIILDTPGVTSESGSFDYNEAFTSVKKGGKVTTQLAWVLQDTVAPIEIEFGINEEYKPAYVKTLILSGGETTEVKKNTEKELAKSDYSISWSEQYPEKIGDENEQAIIKNIAIVDSANFGTVLVIDIDFTNNLDDARNLINDTKCSINPYQNGIALETPGTTSDGKYFNYGDSFTSVKKGGKVSTQLVWQLNDESPIEIEFGMDSNYNCQYVATLSFEK